MKKIGILTLPLWNNYGGILQCFALNSKLKSLGYETLVIDYQKKPQSKVDKINITLKNFTKRTLFKNKKMNLSQTDEFRAYVSSKTRNFVENELNPLSVKICKLYDLRALNKTLDGVIVGSDQVWRPDYAPDWKAYFLDFLEPSKIRVSYAASFGKENVNFTDEQLQISRRELSKFNAISVREKSGVNIVKNEFGFNSDWVLDPTFLLESSEYRELLEKYREPKSKGNLFTYILDHNSGSTSMINKVSEALNLIPFEVNSRVPKVDYVNIDSHVYPNVTKWLKAFDDAEFVIADSFHGCVFSIIFNKPFIAIGNKQRGLTRFNSLLETFNLESRLVLNSEDINENLINYKFDWDAINRIKLKKKDDSLRFLKEALSGQNEEY
ncbi:polysaccharide pyruvyl transferase family protein [Vibrio ulleungensis]|uniref:Polysaccharide pyruvyl transferase family protein n=1 Tax=Vibrio ulleungensis TaxID=2807619 RepID=A0ABS2HNR2_9VIBR|nr:polysaccharide pyruvyl transferase family protein [Vibrio ulleungensis]MBM7037694.1 polysaccharide pyruvyl transferase family protein [Vibrio ulleungensis]